MQAKPAQQEGATMSTHENKAVVRRLLEEAWNQNQLAEIDAYIAADRVHHGGTGVGLQGPEALRAGITAWRTGKPVCEAEIFVFRVVGGKIVESWATWDRLSMLEQLDALPEPTPAQR